jgi:hypothetical protein
MDMVSPRVIVRELSMRRLTGTCLVAGLTALAAPAWAGNLIKDGSFETPAPPAGGYTDYDPGQKIGAWTVVGGHNVTISSTTEVNDGVTLHAKRGAAFADLTGNCDCGDPTQGVAQTVKTTPGTTYSLTFWVGNCDIPGHGTTSTVNVYVGSTLLVSAKNGRGHGSTKQVWVKFTASFVATAATTTLSFLNGDPSGDEQNGLDDVTLVSE